MTGIVAHPVAPIDDRRGIAVSARLIDKQGDDKLTDRVLTHANCDKARGFSLYDRCKARYGLCP